MTGDGRWVRAVAGGSKDPRLFRDDMSSAGAGTAGAAGAAGAVGAAGAAGAAGAVFPAGILVVQEVGPDNAPLGASMGFPIGQGAPVVGVGVGVQGAAGVGLLHPGLALPPALAPAQCAVM